MAEKLTTLELFRARQQSKKHTVVIESYDKKYDFSSPPIDKTMGRIIIGIDSDTKACGVSAYDTRDGSVPFYEEVEPAFMQECLGDLQRDYGKDLVLFRLETITMQTIYGVVKDLRAALRGKASKQEIEKQVFALTLHSGRCHEICNSIIASFRRLHAPHHLVPSQNRTNFKKGRFRQMEDEQFVRYLKQCFMSNRDRCYPSKVSAKKLKLAFPAVKVAGSEENKDALLLACPEAAYRKLQRKER
jgi:hypothetical protein